MNRSVLIIDDEPHIRLILSTALEGMASRVDTAESAEDALEILQDHPYDVVISDIRMPGMDGLELLRRIRNEQPWVRVLLITAHGTMDTVIEAMRLGAADFMPKPIDHKHLRDVVGALLDSPEQSSAAELEGDELSSDSELDCTEKTSTAKASSSKTATPRKVRGIVGQSDTFLQALQMIEKVSASDSSVLILGESGTGKEVLARHLHKQSARSGNFVPVNCGAIPENLMESELFGYEKGAFTGALEEKAGKFELADGGTLFLDEIGEMPLELQVKLLRVLQEREVERVGSAESRKVNFRLVAATHRNLQDAVAAGTFREDLYYRLNVIPVQLPPLRERGDDVTELAEFFLERLNCRYECSWSLTPDQLQLLRSWHWPGNIRELENIMERAVVLADPEYGLDFSSVQEAISGNATLLNDGRQSKSEPKDNVNAQVAHSHSQISAGDCLPAGSPHTIQTSVNIQTTREQAERQVILKTLEANHQNRTRTAEALGISRRNLLYKLKAWGIN